MAYTNPLLDTYNYGSDYTTNATDGNHIPNGLDVSIYETPAYPSKQADPSVYTR